MNNKKREDSTKESECELDIKEIYTPFSVAKEEIKKRWKDKKLRDKVEKFLGGEIPKPFKKEPRAVLSRHIISPNMELFYFLDLAKTAKLKPVGLEGLEDKFCTKNSDKVSLAKLSFYEKAKEEGKKTRFEKRVVRLIDIEKNDGKKLCEIDTLWGENLVDFHHRLLNIYDSEIDTFDDFCWFSKRNKRNSAFQYYENFLLLFLCHGILFENFHAKGKEKSFTEDIIMTNYKKIVDTFNIKPLIVPLVPIEDEMYSHHWNGYFANKKKK